MEASINWIDDHILSPLGDGTLLNFQEILAGESGIGRHSAPEWLVENRPSSFFPQSIPILNWYPELSRLENLIAHSIEKIFSKNQIDRGAETILIISSTKGNIGHGDTQLARLGQKIQAHFGFKNKTIIVSNACISGGLALSVAKDFLVSSTVLKQAIVCGADELSPFIYSGFESFQALSNTVCKPFDHQRNGLNLGEAVGTVLLEKSNFEKRTPSKQLPKARLLGFGNRNDANHISGPSRTGEGLFQSIQEAFEKSDLATNSSIDFISAHGTATLYNDEMESIALERAGLSHTPVNSLKAYYGHTLGASALIESILSVESLQQGYLIPSKGFNAQGTSVQLPIITQALPTQAKRFLKLASGFGGCNLAYIIEKYEQN